jgi:ankyrin repeat protein
MTPIKTMPLRQLALLAFICFGLILSVGTWRQRVGNARGGLLHKKGSSTSSSASSLKQTNTISVTASSTLPMLQPIDKAHYKAVRTFSTSSRPLPLELYVAARRGDVGLLHELIGRGANVNGKIGDGKTALIGAALSGSTAMVTELIVLHADVDVADKYGKTALHAAAENGFSEIIALLLTAGAKSSVHARTFNDLATPFLKASRNGHLEAVSLLITAGSHVDVYDVDGRSALTYAAEDGKMPIVRLLIAAGANVDYTERSNGKTPLMMASGAGHLSIVEALLSAGATLNKTSIWDKMTSLMRACAGGHYAVAKKLIELGSNVNAAQAGSGQDGITVLMHAAQSGNLQIVQLLVNSGANINFRSKWKHDGLTALDFASERNAQEVENFLIDKGGKRGDELPPMDLPQGVYER